MPFSYQQHTANGSTSVFSAAQIDGYLSPNHIKVYVDNVLKTAGTHYNLQTSPALQVTFTSANIPANGQAVRIQRITPATTASREVDFEDGSVLTAADLDRSALQLLFIAQESEDLGSGALAKDFDQLGWNAEGLSIRNSDAGTSPSSLATKGYVDTLALYGGTPAVPQAWVLSGDSVQTAFTLSPAANATDVNSFIVEVDGTLMNPGTDYTVPSSTLLQFAAGSIPGVGTDNIKVRNIGISRSLNDSVSTAMIQNNAVTTAKIANGSVTLAKLSTAVSSKLNAIVSVKDFGAAGDGVTDDTAAIAAALASLPNGGALYFPSGTYRTYRGYAPNNIVSNNITIFGDGASTIIDGNPFGPIDNSPYNQFYNVFQATGRSNITLRDMSFRGVCQPISCFECKNVRVTGIIDDAQLVQNEVENTTITNITQGNPQTFTYTGADPDISSSIRRWRTITGVVGMTEINTQTIYIDNLNTTAKTFTSNLFSTAGYGAYVSGGTMSICTNWTRDKSVYFHKCEDVLVHGCTFLNPCFPVYVSGDSGKKTSRCITSNCHFEQTTPEGQFSAMFPCAVYWFYADDCVVEHCTFVDIYSSAVRGSSGAGAGYAIYEGDGISTNGTIVGNTFRFRPKGELTATCIYVSEMDALTISSNTFETDRSDCIRLDSKKGGMIAAVTGNTFKKPLTSPALAGNTAVHVVGGGAGFPTNPANAMTTTISDNVMDGQGIRIIGFGNGRHLISGNTIRNASAQGIMLWGFDPYPHKFVSIVGNRIERSQNAGIQMNSRCLQTHIASNVILDGNLSNTADDAGAAILFTSFSYGSTIIGNVIGNTPYGGGLFTYGVSNVQQASGQIFKNITANNSFVGLADGTQYRRFFSTSPTNGIYDVVKGDFTENSGLNAAGSPGWYCVFKRAPELSSNASSASTTVTVSSTANFAAGDIVLLTKKKDVYDASYYTDTEWHVTTIASVTNSTQFVLATGIPAGDGTYAAGTAGVYVARFKAAASIAS